MSETEMNKVLNEYEENNEMELNPHENLSVYFLTPAIFFAYSEM